MQLLKYDFKGIFALCFPAYLIGGIGMVLNGILGLVLDNYYAYFFLSGSNTPGNILGSLFSMAYLCTNFAILFIVIATVVWVVVDFYRSIFGKIAYLTHTLPEPPWKILCSKLLVANVAIIGSSFVVYLFYFILYTLPNANLTSFLNLLQEEAFVQFIIPFFVATMAALELHLFLLFGSIALGHLTKHKIALSVVFYLVLYNFVGNIPFFFTVVYMLSSDHSGEPLSNNSVYEILGIFTLITFLICAIFYKIILSIMTKKLNLE